MPRKPSEKKPKTTLKQEKFVEGVVQHGNLTKAALEAGYSPDSARQIGSENLSKPYIREHIEARKAEVIALAQIHTDVIVGSLVDIMLASVDDVVDDDGEFSLSKARETGAIRAVKRLEKTKDGYKVEMYSRLDAISQARDNWGMKQEPRANTYEETRRVEVEREIDKIAASEGCSRADAAIMLRDALGKDSPLIPTVNKYVN